MNRSLERRIEILESEYGSAILPQATKDILFVLSVLEGQSLTLQEEQRLSEMWVQDEKVLRAFHEGRLEKVLIPGHGYKVVIHDRPVFEQVKVVREHE